MAENEQQPGVKLITIPLDGTYGAGPACEITVITRESAESSRMVETTFTMPYALLAVGALVKMLDINLIAGYRIEKQPMPNPLREMGL